jgi:hypothetical protein
VDLDMAIEESGAASGVPFAILEVIWPWWNIEWLPRFYQQRLMPLRLLRLLFFIIQITSEYSKLTITRTTNPSRRNPLYYP